MNIIIMDQQKIEEINSTLNELKKVKRKMYCSEYYKKHRERILTQARDKLSNNDTGKTDFYIEKKQVTITFD